MKSCERGVGFRRAIFRCLLNTRCADGDCYNVKKKNFLFVFFSHLSRSSPRGLDRALNEASSIARDPRTEIRDETTGEFTRASDETRRDARTQTHRRAITHTSSSARSVVDATPRRVRVRLGVMIPIWKTRPWAPWRPPWGRLHRTFRAREGGLCAIFRFRRDLALMGLDHAQRRG